MQHCLVCQCQCVSLLRLLLLGLPRYSQAADCLQPSRSMQPSLNMEQSVNRALTSPSSQCVEGLYGIFCLDKM